MTLISDILAFNRRFVAEERYAPFKTDRYPSKKLVLVTCMDTRLTELLPAAMNIRNGEAKLIKSAGAVVSHPFGSLMRSILVAVYELGAEELAVVGHHDCGMVTLRSESILGKAVERGIRPETISTLRHAGIDVDEWLSGVQDVESAVRKSVSQIRQHPLFPTDVPVHGLVIDPETGKLDKLEDGYAAIKA